MFKKLLLAVCFFFAALSPAWAAVDVNAASAEALEGIKGIGPAKAKAIVAERDAHGPYKNGADLAARVKGLGEKSVAKLQADALVIGAGAPAKPAAPPAPKKAAAK
jgi:competence protein ComEA